MSKRNHSVKKTPQAPVEAPLSFQDLPQNLRRKCLFEALDCDWIISRAKGYNEDRVNGDKLRALCQVITALSPLRAS
jgi:hypothetical protein